MIAYHIDRGSTLFQNSNIELIKNITIDSATHLSSVIHSNYPDGLSYHGIRYYSNACNSSQLKGLYDFLKENILEYERRIHFPSLISRFQSLFAAANMEELDIWRSFFNLTSNSYKIFKIAYEDKNAIKLDASWIDKITPHSFLSSHYYAKKYWSGEISSNPKMELLIKPPITVIERVEI